MSEELASLQSAKASRFPRRAEKVCDDLRRSEREVGRLAPPQAICEELQEALEKAAQRSVESMRALRLAVARFTISLRDDGASPEAILISLKSVINAKTFEGATPTRDWTDGELRQLISTWSIEEFFNKEADVSG